MSDNHCQLTSGHSYKPQSNSGDPAAVASDIGRLFLQPELSDLVLVVGQRRYPVHRVVLAARSSYFRALLYSGLKETFQREIEIGDASEDAFELVLRYLYRGSIAISLDEADDELEMALLALAHRYGLAGLEGQISAHLSERLGEDNVAALLNVAVLYGMSGLRDTSLRYLDKRSADCLSAGTTMEAAVVGALSQGALCAIISRDSFCASEISIFEAVVQWLDINKATCTADSVQEVLSHIRLCLISASDLLCRVRPTGLVPADSILDAMERQLKLARLPHRGLMIPEENLAKTEWNAAVIQGGPDAAINQYCVPEHIDPSDTVFAEHHIEDQGRIVLRLGNPSKINMIRMHLMEREGRSYSYLIDVSLDQVSWTTVADYRKYICRSWQHLYFDPIVVQYIRVIGTRNTVSRTFTVLQFECLYTDVAREHCESVQIPKYNVASIEHHATVIEGVSRCRNSLLNGETKNYNWDSGYTCHQLGNGAIVVQLSQPYIVNNIKFLLWDLDSRSYSYTVEVSVDKSKWVMVSDKSAELCSSYQNLYFDSQPVVFIRIIGTYNSANEVFHIVHLETFYQQIEPVLSDHAQE